jgi:antitoxin (DNA-binding transcriptional repressor) of toxin-antitoxin stability system
MKTVSIHDAKTNLSKYIAAAKKGEKIYIGGFGKAEVVLTRIQPTKAKKRDFSSLKGLAKEGPDSFSEETDKEIADMMNYGDL